MSGNAINDVKHNDEAQRRSRFTVEISGGSDPKSTGGVWLSISGGGLEVKDEANPTGGDSLRVTTAGQARWQDLVLRGPLTADRKDIITWWKDMNEKGEDTNCYRTVTITFFARDGAEVDTISYNDCWLKEYRLTPADSKAGSEPMYEEVVIDVGFSTDFFS
jgi:hypothetical protein